MKADLIKSGSIKNMPLRYEKPNEYICSDSVGEGRGRSETPQIVTFTTFKFPEIELTTGSFD